jgi:hypothetical protein
MWMIVACAGIMIPSLVGLLQLGDYDYLSYFGGLITIASLSYGIASNQHFGIWKRVPAVVVFIMACLWILDSLSGFLFDVQINYPWWGIIDFSLLFLMFLNSFIQGLTEKTGCFVYVRKPLTFQDLLATIFGGCLVTTATEFQGKFYGFRKGKLIELTDFDKTKYERRNAPIALGEKIVANLGKPWRPWRNCVLIVWR